MVITVQITPDGKATEMTSEEADEQKWERIYSGASLNVPERWEHPRQYRLTMIMPDTFDCDDDDMNVLATTIYRRLRSESYTPEDIIYGTVYIGNENADEVIDFTKEDLTYICKQVLNKKNPNSKIKHLKEITHRLHKYIYTDMDMQNTTTEPLSEEESAKQQQKLAELRRYDREYDHAHKKASECEHCKKVFLQCSHSDAFL